MMIANDMIIGNCL